MSERKKEILNDKANEEKKINNLTLGISYKNDIKEVIIEKDGNEINNNEKKEVIIEKDSNDNFDIHSKNEKIKDFNSEKILNSEINLKGSSSASSLDSLNIKDYDIPLATLKDDTNVNSKTLNLISPYSTKSKAISSTVLQKASSSSVIVNSNSDATLPLLNIKNSAKSQSINTDIVESISSSKKNNDKKKVKGKHKAKTEEEQEIEEIRNNINFSDMDLADEFMGLASSSVTNINKPKMENTDNNKGKNKSKENKNATDTNKITYGKGPSAVVEGPYTVFHSSSSSSSLDFLLESAAVASSSHNNNDTPPLNINFNRHSSNQQLNNSNNLEDINNENNSNSERYDINHLASSSSNSLLGLRYTQKNLDDILLKPVPIDQSIKCTLIRSKMKNVPSYELYIENTDSTFSLLLYSRKIRIGNHSEYVITKKVFTTNVPDESEIIGRLKSNFVGTAFVLYDNNKKQVKKENINELRSELGAVLYEPNILGFKGPRKMKIITTRLNEEGDFITCKPHHAKETLIERSKDPFDKEMLVLYNKAPQWNEETQSYVLNFNHRVRIASVKNFQIINNDDLDYIIMQFGKKKKNIFTLDFRYPFSALLAFSIALTSLDTKIACE